MKELHGTFSFLAHPYCDENSPGIRAVNYGRFETPSRIRLFLQDVRGTFSRCIMSFVLRCHLEISFVTS